MRNRTIDAGGSVTRIARTENEIFKFNSVCMEIPEDSPEKGHIIQDKSLDFVIRKCSRAELEGRRFVKAEAMLQYAGNMLVCDNSEVKVVQDITYINIIYAIAADCLRRSINDQEFCLIVCIPAAEFYDDENCRVEEVKESLAGDTTVFFPMLDKTIRYHIEKKNINVVAEGVVAALKYKTDANFVKKCSAVVDIGYRSTDITVMRGFKPVGASAASHPIGGINLEAFIQSRLVRANLFVNTDAVQQALCTVSVLDDTEELIPITEYIDMAKSESGVSYIDRTVQLAAADQIEITPEQVKKAVTSHYVVQGQVVYDITEYVHVAKEVFVDHVYKAIQNVVNAKMMNISEISNVLCVGRPFSGDAQDPYCLVNMLRGQFKHEVAMYSVPDAGIANIVEMAKILLPEE